MTTITPFAAGSYITNRNASQLLTLKNQLNDLSNQLSSGQVSQTYGGLGSGRSTALAAQATLSALNGYASGITAAQTRTNLAVTSLTQVASIGTSTASTLQNGLQSVAANSVSGRATALANLQTVLDTLNQSAAGNYLFGGTNTETQRCSMRTRSSTDRPTRPAKRSTASRMSSTSGSAHSWAPRGTAG